MAQPIVLRAVEPPSTESLTCPLPQEGHLLRALARQAYGGAVGLMATALRLWVSRG